MCTSTFPMTSATPIFFYEATSTVFVRCSPTRFTQLTFLNSPIRIEIAELMATQVVSLSSALIAHRADKLRAPRLVAVLFFI